MEVYETNIIAIKEEPIEDETDPPRAGYIGMMQGREIGDHSLCDVIDERKSRTWNEMFIKEEWIEDDAVKEEYKEEGEALAETETAAIPQVGEWVDVKEEYGGIAVTLKEKTPSSDETIEFTEAGREVTISSTEQKKKRKRYNKVNQHDAKPSRNSSPVPNLRDETKSYECGVCDYTGRTEQLLRDHIRRVHYKDKPNCCNVCGRGFFSRGHLMRHMITHTGEKPYACKICHVRFSQKGSLTKHTKRCSLPQMKFISDRSLKSRFYACDLCEFSSIRANHLESHIRIHTKKTYTCYVCQYTFSKKRILKAHVNMHADEKSYWCTTCNKSYMTSIELKYHQYKHSLKTLSCEKCDYSTKCISSLKTHIRRKHTGEKPFSCQYCDYKCTKMSDVRRHEAIHTGLKLFACDYCEYKCSRHDVLASHVRIHTGEKPYTCDLCDYANAQLANLKHHMRIHHKEKKTTKIARRPSIRKSK